MAGLMDSIDPQTALLLGLSSGLLGTQGNGRRASFGEALANGMQQGTAGYRQAIGDRQRAEQMRMEQAAREQAMRLAMEESQRAQGRFGMEQQRFTADQAENARKLREQLQMRELALRFAKGAPQMALERGAQAGSVGPTTANAERLQAAPNAAGYDFSGYADALAGVNPMAALNMKQALRKEEPAPVVVSEGAALVNPKTGQPMFSNPKAVAPTDAGRKLAELKALGYPDQVAQGIAYGMLDIVPDGNGGTAIVHKAQALGALGGSPQMPQPAMPQNQTAPISAPQMQRGPFDAPPPMPGQIGGNPGSNNVKARIAAEENLRKEFTSLPTVKTYSQAFPAYQNILAAASRNNPQADINLVYGIAKLYDPDSVVREGEYATIASSQNVPEAIKGWAQFLMGGGRLTEETKKQLAAEAESRHTVLRQGYDQSANQFRQLAQKSGIDPATVVTSFGRAAEQSSTEKTTVAPKTVSGGSVSKLKTISKSDVDAIVREAFAMGKTRAQVLQKLQDEGYAIPLK